MPQTHRFSFFIEHAGVDEINNISKLLLNFCKESSKYSNDIDLSTTIRQACEVVAKNASWSSATGYSVAYFSKETFRATLTAIAHINDKKLFEMALPIAFLGDDDSQIKEAINTMSRRHGEDWLISRYVSVFKTAP